MEEASVRPGRPAARGAVAGSVSAGCCCHREEKADTIAGGCAESNAAGGDGIPGTLDDQGCEAKAVSAKGELEPSHVSRKKWTDSQIERRGWQEDGLILTVPFWLCVCVYLSACLYRVVEKKKSVSRQDVLALEKKMPTRSPEAVRKATRQSMSGYQGGSTTKKKA